MTFLIGTLFGLIGGAWLAYRFHGTIENFLSKLDD